MDNITHTLTGVVLSRVGLNRWYARSALVLMLAANIPDIDIVTAVRGALPYFIAHRGYTHSIAMAPLMALLPMLLAGCDGGTNAVAGFAPRLTRRLFELVGQLNLDEARRVQEQIIDLFDAVVYGADFPEGIRAAVDVLGFRTGSGRQPLGQDQQARIAALREKLAPLFRTAGILK